MPTITPGKVILTVSAVCASAGSFAFDWNTTHIYNDQWPPHAKYHNAQTMSVGVALVVLTLRGLWGGGPWSRSRLDAAAGAASIYWATQLSALAFPGVALMDPPKRVARTGPQAVIASLGLLANLVGHALEVRRLAGTGGRG